MVLSTPHLVVGLPPAALASLRLTLPDAAFFAWTNTPYVEALRPHLPQGFLPVELSSGVGAFNLFRPSSRRDTVQAKLREHGRRQGWSAAKTERAIQQASQRDFSKRFVGLRPSVRGLLAELVRKHGRLYVLTFSVRTLDQIALVAPVHGTATASAVEGDSSVVREGLLLTVEPD